MPSSLFYILPFVAICKASIVSLEERQALACPFVPISGCDISAKDPSPSNLICNTKGKISSPDPIIRDTPCFASDLETCRDNCFQAKGCESFGFDAPMANCFLYGKRVKDMGFTPTPKSTSELRFWNKRCFTSYPCTTGPVKVYDPGFESATAISSQTGDPTSKWEYSSNTGGVCNKSTDAVHSGNKAAKCTLPSGGSVVLNQELPTLIDGRIYSLSLWFAGKLYNSAPSIDCTLSVANIPMATFSPCSSASDPGCLDNGSAPVYRQTRNVTFQVQVPASLAISCTTPDFHESGGALVYLDDVNIQLDRTFPSYPSPRACWVGEIHSPCDGAQTGCTPDGFRVHCDDEGSPPSQGDAMIFAAQCGPPTGGPWTCHCINGVAKC